MASQMLLLSASAVLLSLMLHPVAKADEPAFRQVFERMAGYYPGSTVLHPQRLNNVQRDMGRGTNLESAAAYLATVNLSAAPSWNYQLKTLKRPSGRATRVIVTEYDL